MNRALGGEEEDERDGEDDPDASALPGDQPADQVGQEGGGDGGEARGLTLDAHEDEVVGKKQARAREEARGKKMGGVGGGEECRDVSEEGPEGESADPGDLDMFPGGMLFGPLALEPDEGPKGGTHEKREEHGLGTHSVKLLRGGGAATVGVKLAVLDGLEGDERGRADDLLHAGAPCKVAGRLGEAE